MEDAEKEGDQHVAFAGDVRARITELHQTGTYAGLLDGGPSASIDQRLLDRLAEPCSARRGWLLLAPERPTEPPAPARRHRPLPAVRCQATLVAGDGELDVVWFQDDLALPIDPIVRERLRELEFAGRCRPAWWVDA